MRVPPLIRRVAFWLDTVLSPGKAVVTVLK
jgi:hypothetical protein